MKKSLLPKSILGCCLLLSQTVYAENYKKVVLASFLVKDEAQAKYDLLIEDIDKKLAEEKAKYPFNVVVRESGSYHIIAAEPFKYVREAKEVLTELSDIFPSAYINNNAETFDENETSSDNLKEEKKVDISEKIDEKKEETITQTMDEDVAIEKEKVEKDEVINNTDTDNIQKFTLNEIVKEIITTDPEIKERIYQYNSIMEDLNISKAGYYPTVDLYGKVGRKSVKKENTAKDSFDHSEVSLKLVQNIFNGFGTQAAVNRDDARAKAAFNKLKEVTQDKIYRAIEAYIKVLRYGQVLEIAKDNVKVHEETLLKIEDRYEKGFSTLSEVERVKGRLSLARSNYISETNNLYDAKFSFHKALGRYVDEKALVKPEFKATLPKTLEHAIDIAIHNNPSILVANEDIKVAKEALKYTKKNDYPTLDIELEATRYNNYNSSAEGREDDRSAMLVLNYNLFNGGADSAQKQKYISLLNYEYERKNTLKRDIIESLGLSWSAYKMISKQYKYQVEYRDLTMKTKVAYDEEFQLGRRTLIDLLDVQDEVNHIKINVIHSTYDLLFSKFRVLDGMGDLINYFDEELKEDYKKDIVKIYPDQDNDNIIDCEDQCDNSLTQTTNLYGCEGINCIEVDKVEFNTQLETKQSEVNKEEIETLWGKSQ